MEDTVTNIKDKHPEFVLALGDYSYRPKADCWLDEIKPIDSITRINIGNHEDQVSEDFNEYMNHFRLSLPYYSFDYENVHVLTMTYESKGYTTSSPQYDFVINDLQTAFRNPKIDWIIVSVHEWLYRASSYNPHNDDLAELYHPIFDKYGVDMVLSGHDHSYHRTYPLRFNSGEPTNPIVTNNNTNDYVDPAGQIYVVVGTGGINLIPISGSTPFVASAEDDSFGQLDVRVTNNGNKIEAKFYRNGNDAILDSFSISKGLASPPVANNLTASVIKNTPTPLTLSAKDSNNDPLTYSILKQPLNGTVSAESGAVRTFTPKVGFTGDDFFTFKAFDGKADSNIATVKVNVIQIPQGFFNYSPSFTLTGTNYDTIESSSSLQLQQFSVAAWFKTSTNYTSTAYIVNKGGTGSDLPGQNMNYGIWMTSDEKIQAGFETPSAIDLFVTSSGTYNDNRWHYATVTYDGANVILYVDGIQVGIKSTDNASPEFMGTKPVRVGANSRVSQPANLFIGQIDEIRVWNDDLTPQQMGDAYAGTSFNTGNQVLYLPFTEGGN